MFQPDHVRVHDDRVLIILRRYVSRGRRVCPPASSKLQTFRKMRLSITLFLIVLAPLAIESASAESTYVMRRGNVAITPDDVKLSVELAIPKQEQPNFWSSEKRVRDYIANMFVARQLAVDVQQAGLTESQKRKLKEIQVRTLSQFELERLYTMSAKPDFARLAENDYKASPEKFEQPEEVRAEHILISTKTRSEDDARTLAESIIAKAKSASSPFSDLAVEFSDDPSAKSNKGDLGFFKRGRMVKSFEDAAFSLVSPGEIAGPIKTPYGFHVIKLIDRKPKTVIPFEKVKERLIAEEEAKFRSEIANRRIEAISKMDGIEIDQAAIDGLVVKPAFMAPSNVETRTVN